MCNGNRWMRRERLRLRIIGLRAVERKKEEAGSSESSERIGATAFTKNKRLQKENMGHQVKANLKLECRKKSSFQKKSPPSRKRINNLRMDRWTAEWTPTAAAAS